MAIIIEKDVGIQGHSMGPSSYSDSFWPYPKVCHSKQSFLYSKLLGMRFYSSHHFIALSLDGAPLESAVARRDAEDECDERHEHLSEALLDVAGRLGREGEEVDHAVVRHVHHAQERHLAQPGRRRREQPHLQKIMHWGSLMDNWL